MKYSLESFKRNEFLETENVSLKTDNANLIAQAKTLEAKVAEADKTASALPLAVKDFETQLETAKADHARAVEALRAEHAAAIEKLNAETAKLVAAHKQSLEAEKASVGNKVVSNLQAIGIKADAVKENISTITRTEKVKDETNRFKLTVVKEKTT